ncbi:tyrosine-type recombinase/integrase [Actinoplanes sp. NPDC051470]|uniref:tyrosine-type recombinase/integrase n=1 Tax=Actinoplanes sp. NPDC051470 TaxID=3157224 RepID=UPI003414536C
MPAATTEAAGLRAGDEPIRFTPHDFRRLFTTEAVGNGLPLHIAAALLGHLDLDTTRGYTAVFQDDVIARHQQFITRRRAVRDAAEYRDVTADEWAGFEKHFQLRRVEARDFAFWLKIAKKPSRQRRPDAPAPGSVNPVTGKATPASNYAARTRRHARAVIRSFYEYHREMHGRPLVNPFPMVKGDGEERLNAHHNPMQPFRSPSRRAAYQPKEPKPAPRSIPDQAFNDLFAALDCNRDRALIAFYISTGARASELLGVCQGLVTPEDQVIGVVRKGSRALQRLPASTDAFVWLRLYQQELRDIVPRGPEEAVWWTLRRPFRPLTYDATRMVFNKTNAALGANWTLHGLRLAR